MAVPQALMALPEARPPPPWRWVRCRPRLWPWGGRRVPHGGRAGARARAQPGAHVHHCVGRLSQRGGVSCRWRVSRLGQSWCLWCLFLRGGEGGSGPARRPANAKAGPATATPPATPDARLKAQIERRSSSGSGRCQGAKVKGKPESTFRLPESTGEMAQLVTAIAPSVVCARHRFVTVPAASAARGCTEPRARPPRAPARAAPLGRPQ